MLWSRPTTEQPSLGLGNGITFAWDSRLCEALLSQFNEDLPFARLVTCDSLRAAVTRAFASWSAHHPLIAFHDVTNECFGGPPLGEPGSPLYLAPSAGSSSGGSLRCTLAEVFISSEQPDAVTASTSSAGGELAATAATSYITNPSARPFVSTNGVAASNTVFEANEALLSFNASLCWYLDSTFCSQFHQLKTYMGEREAIICGQFIIFFIWLGAYAESESAERCTALPAHLHPALSFSTALRPSPPLASPHQLSPPLSARLLSHAHALRAVCGHRRPTLALGAQSSSPSSQSNSSSSFAATAGPGLTRWNPRTAPHSAAQRHTAPHSPAQPRTAPHSPPRSPQRALHGALH